MTRIVADVNASVLRAGLLWRRAFSTRWGDEAVESRQTNVAVACGVRSRAYQRPTLLKGARLGDVAAGVGSRITS
jgi:hypothetical protein